MTGLQKLVTSIGAAEQGFKGLRGQFPQHILARTHLQLMASPHAGSVVLDFIPESLPGDELYPGDDVPLIDPPKRQLVDAAIADAIGLIESARTLGPDADEGTFLAAIAQRGPRVAGALRDLTRCLSAADFEADLTWREPGHPALRTVLTPEDAQRIADLIKSRELDHGQTEIEGVIHTVSDRTALAIERDDGLYEYVRVGDLTHDTLQEVRWGSRVRVVVDAVEEQRPGGESIVRYSAKSLTVLPDRTA